MAVAIPEPNAQWYLLLYNPNGAAAYKLVGSVDANNNFLPVNLSATGLETTTSGVSDSTNKRFVTDAELAYLAAASALTAGETLLSSTAGVDLNSLNAETTLYTVPSGKSCVITRVIVRLASTSLTTAQVSFGFNAGTDNDVIAAAAHTELTGNTLYTILIPKTGAKIGTTTGLFAVKNTTAQGGAATVTIDAFGYLF